MKNLNSRKEPDSSLKTKSLGFGRGEGGKRCQVTGTGSVLGHFCFHHSRDWARRSPSALVRHKKGCIPFCYLLPLELWPKQRKQKTQKSQTLKLTNKKYLQGEASRDFCQWEKLHKTPGEASFVFSWTFYFVSCASILFFFHLLLFTSGYFHPLSSFLRAFSCHWFAEECQGVLAQKESTDASEMPPGGCSETGAARILVPALGNPGAVIEVPVIWVNCAQWTQSQRHTSLVAPPINNLYVYIEKPRRLISSLY